MYNSIMNNIMNRKYKLIRSHRRTISIGISKDGEITVRAPLFTSLGIIERFIASKASWIEKHIAMATDERQKEKAVIPLTEAQRADIKRDARKDLTARLDFFASIIGVKYNALSLRFQKTRWGSCTSKGNISLNCLLMLAPEDVRNYVVVHELCHLIHMNHSKAFWCEVEKVIPEYKMLRKWLRDNGNVIIRKL